MANQLMAEPGVSEAMSGMVEQIGRGSMARAGHRPGQAANSPAPDASQGLGGLMQGLAPMMQQLMSGGSGPNAGVAAGNRQNTLQGSPEQDLQSALQELDERERAEWEETIR